MTLTAAALLVLQLAIACDGLAVVDANEDAVHDLIALGLVEEVAEDFIFATPEGDRVVEEAAR